MPRAAVLEDWQQRRSRLNHDWLKNRHLNRLEGILALLEAASPSPEPLAEFFHDDLAAWERRVAEVRALIASFEAEMSPRALFGAPPLCRLPREAQTWLGDRLHDLWRARIGSAGLLAAAGEALDEAECAVARLRARLAVPPPLTGARARGAREEIEAFRDTCRALADAVAALPHEIIVP